MMITILILIVLLYIVVGVFLLFAQLDFIRKEDPKTLEQLPGFDFIKYCCYTIIMWLPNMIEFMDKEDGNE